MKWCEETMLTMHIAYLIYQQELQCLVMWRYCCLLRSKQQLFQYPSWSNNICNDLGTQLQAPNTGLRSWKAIVRQHEHFEAVLEAVEVIHRKNTGWPESESKHNLYKGLQGIQLGSISPYATSQSIHLLVWSLKHCPKYLVLHKFCQMWNRYSIVRQATIQAIPHGIQ